MVQPIGTILVRTAVLCVGDATQSMCVCVCVFVTPHKPCMCRVGLRGLTPSNRTTHVSSPLSGRVAFRGPTDPTLPTPVYVESPSHPTLPNPVCVEPPSVVLLYPHNLVSRHLTVDTDTQTRTPNHYWRMHMHSRLADHSTHMHNDHPPPHITHMHSRQAEAILESLFTGAAAARVGRTFPPDPSRFGLGSTGSGLTDSAVAAGSGRGRGPRGCGARAGAGPAPVRSPIPPPCLSSSPLPLVSLSSTCIASAGRVILASACLPLPLFSSLLGLCSSEKNSASRDLAGGRRTQVTATLSDLPWSEKSNMELIHQGQGAGSRGGGGGGSVAHTSCK